MTRPTGSVAVVTGAAGGLGIAITRALVAGGYRVAAVDLDKARLDNLAAEFDADVIVPLVIDVADSSAVAQGVQTLASAVGPPVVLVNNAGITDKAAFLHEMSDELWQQEMSVHATASFYFTRACLPIMTEMKWGRIVNVSSIAASMGDFAHSAYSASKAAVLGLTKSTALEGARFGITANAILPGIIKTPAYDRIRPDIRDRVVARTALKRPGTADEVASLVGYLATDGAAFLTGQELTVDGGQGLFVF